jgi:hypothetical protein
MFNINRDSLFNINLCTNQRILKRMKQTAVEWFMHELANGNIPAEEAYKQALEMEKEQMKDAWDNGNQWEYDSSIRNSEEYYNETFKKE